MNKRIDLVLSGGGARGFAHAGIIKVLVESGYEITSVTGTSMGALVGGIFAMGRLDEFIRLLQPMRRWKFQSVIDMTYKRLGLFKGERMYELLQVKIPGQNIEDLRIPFAAIATDITNNISVKLDKGFIYDAIKPSIAIPTVFAPLLHEGRLLVDGGVLNNLPTSAAIRTPGSSLLAVNVNAYEPFDEAFLSVYKGVWLRRETFNAVNQSLGLMIDTITKYNLMQAPPDHLMNVSKDTCSISDFHKAPQLIAYGEYAAKKYLEQQLCSSLS